MAVPTANSFLKITAIPIEMGVAHSGQPVDSTSAIARIFIDRIEDLDTISVYFNGQLIQLDTYPAISTDAKFYYTLTNTLDAGWPGAGPELPLVGDTSNAVFTIRTNPLYKAPGYASGTSATSFLSSDSIVISYYYVVYTKTV